MSIARIALALLFIAVNLGVALWDLYCFAVSRPMDTVSYVMGEWSRDFPVLPLLIGIALGHIFWPHKN